jgi:hypothetical protein
LLCAGLSHYRALIRDDRLTLNKKNKIKINK